MKATLIADKTIINTQLTMCMDMLCKQNRIILQKKDMRSLDSVSMSDLIMHKNNLCIQNNKNDRKNYDARTANVLFLRRCPLFTDENFILDTKGVYDASNFVAKGFNRAGYASCIINAVKNRLSQKNYFFDVKDLTKGSIFIFLDDSENETQMLEYCAKYLPKNVKVTIVGEKSIENNLNHHHEKFKNKFDNLSILCDDIKSEHLMQCEAIIVQNNDIVYKAMAMGVKVIAMNDGFYTNTGTVLECKNNPQQLKNCLVFRTDNEMIDNFLAAIYKYGISQFISPEMLLDNMQFLNWLSKMYI